MSTKATGITLDTKVWERTKKAAEEECRSFSNLVNFILQDHKRVEKPLQIKTTAQVLHKYCLHNTLPRITEIQKILTEHLGGV